LQRQKAQVATTNQLLEGMCQKMQVEIGRLKNEPQTCLVQDLRKAATTLCLPIYEHYKLAAERAVNDLILEEVFDEQNQQQVYTVRSSMFDDAPCQMFMSKYDRCTCKVRLKELDMSAHEIKVRGGFDHSCFIQRHFCREHIRGSLVGWTPPENDFIEGLLGCDCEEIDSDNDSIDSTELVEHKATVD